MRRPAGVTFLAALYYVLAGCGVVLAIACIAGPRALNALLIALGGGAVAGKLDVPTPDMRALLGFTSLVSSLVICFVAQGLWRLKNWARVLILVFTILDLIQGGWGSALDPLPQLLSERLIPALWPHSWLVTSGIFFPLLSRLASLIVLLYFLREPLKEAFDAKPREWKWMVVVSAVGFLLLAHDIYKSGPELKAIQYHLRHGNQVTLNGVVFPVYFWYAPEVDSEFPGFAIDDQPGPLRPQGARGSGYIQVLGYKQDDGGLTVEQLVDKRIQSEQRAGYADLSRFDLRIAKQTLKCMNSGQYSHATYCYGDGPIYSVFFTGNEDETNRFKQMMAGAK
jgi:hypothetical protein